MRIRFWGVRGSLPAPLNHEALTAKLFEAVSGAHGVQLGDPDAVRAYLAGLPAHVGGVVGGNTTCVEVRSGEHTIVVDAGSGLRPLGLSLLGREFGRGRGTVHLFFTHAHWDHLIGLPYFKPAYIAGNRIICYAVNHHPLEYLRQLMTAPTYFPIVPEALAASLEFVTLHEGEAVRIGSTTVTNVHLHHPGISYAYRFDDGAVSFVFASDAEFKALDDDTLREHVAFFRGADVLAFDAQFSLKDAFTYEDWGHSSAMIGVDLAIRAGVRRLLTIHHDPNDTDRQIWEVAEAAQEYARLSPGGETLDVSVGYEGLELFLTRIEGVQVTEQVEQGALIVGVAGRLGHAAAQALRERLRALGTGAWPRPVAVDLSGISGIDPDGVAALAETLREAADGPLTLVAQAPRLRRLMRRELRRLDSQVAIYENKTTALAAIVGPAHLRLTDVVAAGRYRLTDVVATDDRTATYRAEDLQMSRPALAQVLNPGLSHAARASYLEAVRAWGRLNHPAFLAVLDILLDEGGLTIAILESPPGPTLKEACRQDGGDGRLPIEAAARVAEQMLEALAYLHG